jgi:hypothetical protein
MFLREPVAGADVEASAASWTTDSWPAFEGGFFRDNFEPQSLRRFVLRRCIRCSERIDSAIVDAAVRTVLSLSSGSTSTLPSSSSVSASLAFCRRNSEDMVEAELSNGVGVLDVACSDAEQLLTITGRRSVSGWRLTGLLCRQAEVAWFKKGQASPLCRILPQSGPPRVSDIFIYIATVVY